jgi:hypothetical protein
VTTGGHGVPRHFYDGPRVPVSSGSPAWRSPMLKDALAGGDGCERAGGAVYHDVPGVLRPLDRLFRRWPSAAGILLVQAPAHMIAVLATDPP